MGIAFVNNVPQVIINGSGGGGGGGVTATAWAAKPTPSQAGLIWWQTDGPYLAVADGSSWSYQAFGHSVTPPDFTSFAWVNQGTATVNTTNGYGSLVIPGAATTNLRLYTRSVADANLTFTVLLSAIGYNVGLCFRNSADGKIATLSTNSTNNFSVRKYNSATSFNSTYIDSSYRSGMGSGAPLWARLRRTGSTRYFEASVDGTNWEPIASHAWTDFVTPDQVGIYGDYTSASVNLRLAVISTELAQ